MKRLMFIFVIACGGGGDDGDGVMPMIDAPTMKPIDAPAQTFPAVCQKLPLSCPNASALATCEAGSAAAFGVCTYLPITTGCVSNGGCPSGAQICRTAESAMGHCTHSCVQDADCVVAGGGSASCATINGVVKICVVN